MLGRVVLTLQHDLTIFAHMQRLLNASDIIEIKRTAKRMKKRGGSMTYMQHLDQVSRELFGVRHFHEAKSLAHEQLVDEQKIPVSPTQFYLRSVQENYLDF